jgi:hypothetical protein
MTFLDNAQLPAFFGNGIFRTDLHAPPATVTKLLKNENCFIDHRDGFKLAYFAAFSAKGTLLLIDFGDRCENRFCYLEGGMDKEMGIGFFNITVE